MAREALYGSDFHTEHRRASDARHGILRAAPKNGGGMHARHREAAGRKLSLFRRRKELEPDFVLIFLLISFPRFH